MDIVSVYKQFPTRADCIEHLEKARWQSKPICPYCESDRSTLIAKEHRYHCNSCYTAFSVTVQTIFHHTHVPLQKWFLAISIILNYKADKVTARQLASAIGVNKNTAWGIIRKINEAMTEHDKRQLLISIIDGQEGGNG